MAAGRLPDPDDPRHRRGHRFCFVPAADLDHRDAVHLNIPIHAFLARLMRPAAYGFARIGLLPPPSSMPAVSAPPPWRKRLVAPLAMAGTLAAGVAGGLAARYLRLPLPWLLGSLATVMTLSLAGAPVRVIRWGRPAGTVVVGASTACSSTRP